MTWTLWTVHTCLPLYSMAHLWGEIYLWNNWANFSAWSFKNVMKKWTNYLIIIEPALFLFKQINSRQQMTININMYFGTENRKIRWPQAEERIHSGYHLALKHMILTYTLLTFMSRCILEPCSKSLGSNNSLPISIDKKVPCIQVSLSARPLFRCVPVSEWSWVPSRTFTWLHVTTT